MSKIIKMLMIFLGFTLWIPLGSTLSYAWEHGDHSHSGGHAHRGFGGRGYSNFGLQFNYSPYYYNPNYYPYYPAYYDTGYYDNTGVILASSTVQTPEIIEQPSQTVVTTAPNYPTTQITPAQTTPTDTANEITINIPNSTGGYTSVSMKRSGNGFTGPQGEFYPEFPRVSTLKAIYG